MSQARRVRPRPLVNALDGRGRCIATGVAPGQGDRRSAIYYQLCELLSHFERASHALNVARGPSSCRDISASFAKGTDDTGTPRLAAERRAHAHAATVGRMCAAAAAVAMAMSSICRTR